MSQGVQRIERTFEFQLCGTLLAGTDEVEPYFESGHELADVHAYNELWFRRVSLLSNMPHLTHKLTSLTLDLDHRPWLD